MPIAEQFARELDKARRSGRTLETLLSSRGLGTLDEAYAVQRALTAWSRRLRRPGGSAYGTAGLALKRGRA